MRLIAIVLAAVLWLDAGACLAAARTAAAPAVRHALECQLGLQVVADWTSAKRGPDYRLDDTPVRHDLDVIQTPSALVKAWADAGPSNLLGACPELKAVVGADRLATAEDRTAVDHLPAPRFMVLTRFTAPFLDRTGTTALVQFSSVCPGLCGSGGVRRYERRGRTWVLADTFGLWVS